MNPSDVFKLFIHLALKFRFSKFRKYLLFFSFSSKCCALDLISEPLALPMYSSFKVFWSSVYFSITSTVGVSPNLFSSSFNSFAIFLFFIS